VVFIGKSQNEFGSKAAVAGREIPVMCGNDFLANGKPQSCALGPSVGAAPKPRKQVRQIGFRDARSLVANRDLIGF
jgi:hypothetical protein